MLMVILVLSLAGCGSSGGGSSQPEDSNEETNSTEGTGTADIRQSEGENVEEKNETQEAAGRLRILADII